MSDKDGRTDFVEQGGIGVGIDLEIYCADGGCHLAEILVERLRVAAELHALEVIRPDAHAEAVEPQFFIEGRRKGYGLRASPGIAPSRLVNEIDTKPFTQEDVLEAFPSVWRSFPCLAELPHAVGEYQRIYPRVQRLLIEHVGVVAVVGVS